MTYLTFFDCSGCGRISYYDCSVENIVAPTQCTTCCSNCDLDTPMQQRIQNTVRVPTGQYLDNLASLTVRGDGVKNRPLAIHNNVNQSQSSDRRQFSNQRQLANPRLRPGKLGPGGIGVDVKHNSFARILARKKAENIRTDSITATKPFPLMGNKIKTFGIVNQDHCRCTNNFSL